MGIADLFSKDLYEYWPFFMDTD